MYTSGKILRRTPHIVDLNNRRDIILNFRNIVNLSYALDMNANEEREKFHHLLIHIGWDVEQLRLMEEIAYYKTMYESHLPHIQKPAGDMIEWKKNEHRWQK